MLSWGQSNFSMSVYERNQDWKLSQIDLVMHLVNELFAGTHHVDDWLRVF